MLVAVLAVLALLGRSTAGPILLLICLLVLVTGVLPMVAAVGATGHVALSGEVEGGDHGRSLLATNRTNGTADGGGGSGDTDNGDSRAPTNAVALLVVNILTYIFLSTVMFGIGAGIALDDLRDVVRRRKAAFLVGLGAQYLVVPAAARLVVSGILAMPDSDAFVVVLIACCPGGSISNALAYFAKGDTALSVAMTAVSNGLAFGTLPLLLLIWTQGFDGLGSKIPFLEIFYSLLMVLLPAGLGIYLKYKRPAWARKAEKVGAIGGGIMIGSSIVVGFATNASTLTDAELLPWKNVVAVMLVAPMGMMFAWLAVIVLEYCWRGGDGGNGSDNGTDVADNAGDRSNKAVPAAVPSPVKATIVIETGVQNTVLALAIVSLSFADTIPCREFFRMQLVIIFWGLMVSTEASVVMLIYRRIIGREERAAKITSGGDRNDTNTTTLEMRVAEDEAA